MIMDDIGDGLPHKDNGWGVAKIWNESLEQMKFRELETREHLWASELGKSPVDLFLKLKGTEPSNPPNARSRRKFEAGNIFEWIVSLMLKRAGILQSSQQRCEYQYPGLLKVTGKMDFLAGGKPDLSRFQQELQQLDLPDMFMRVGTAIVEYLAKQYPDGLAEIPLEIKSTGSFLFEVMERTEQPGRNHRVQLFHYLKAENRPLGNIVYICRDDLRIMEFTVLNPSSVEDEYKNHIAEISKYIQANERPPLAPLIIFDEEQGKFKKNWQVEYSNYLTLLYGFVAPLMYAEPYEKMATGFNRVLGRKRSIDAGTMLKSGKPMKFTPDNEAILVDMKKMGFDPDVYVKKLAAEAEPEESEGGK